MNVRRSGLNAVESRFGRYNYRMGRVQLRVHKLTARKALRPPRRVRGSRDE